MQGVVLTWLKLSNFFTSAILFTSERDSIIYFANFDENIDKFRMVIIFKKVVVLFDNN